MCLILASTCQVYTSKFFQAWIMMNQKRKVHIASQQETVQYDIDGVIFSLTYVSLHLSMTRNISWKQNNLVVTEVHAHILGYWDQ